MTMTAQQAHNVGPLSVRQQNAFQVAFCWQANVGPLLDVYLVLFICNETYLQ